MKILVIGLGELGNHVLQNISKSNSVDIEVYTRDFSKYKKLQTEKISCLENLNVATQPDLIFITANLYKPEDRLKYLEINLNTKNGIDFRDDEKTTNEEMILNITKGINHLTPVPVIMTANPPELLVKDMKKELGWSSIYNMQMMLDNTRISKITGLPENEYLCIGEHGRAVPTLSYLGKVEDSIYNKIDDELSKIGTTLLEKLKGIPPKDEAKQALDKLINSIVYNKELKCILTTFDSEIDVGFGKPFLVNSLNFKEQPIPKLSSQEQYLVQETQIRLRKKWG